MPHIKTVHEKRYAQDPHVTFVLVSIDDDPKRLGRYLDQMKFPFTVARATLATAEKTFNVTDTPTTFYIDKSGTVRYTARGIEPHGDADARVAWFVEELKRR